MDATPDVLANILLSLREVRGLPGYVDPVLKSKMLRTRLRGLRGRTRMTQKDVARALEWSAMKVLRIEGGDVHVSLTDLNALLSLYRVGDAGEAEELRELARGARQQPWTWDYRDHLHDVFLQYLGYEASAQYMLKAEALTVPGLLQTRDYARVLLEKVAPFDAPTTAQVDVQVEARLKRQAMLFGGAHPQLRVILDEAVIRRPVGGTEVMVDQLHHLQHMAERDDVTIQVVPFGAGATRGLLAPFTVLDFDEPAAESMLFIETPHQQLLTFEDRAMVSFYHGLFCELEDLATPAEEFGQVAEMAIDQLQRTTFSLV